MQTLRKKTSPLKYKNETTRFLGDGVSFKAKLIGILEVSEARGDRMCQEALSDLKMAIRAAGEHKQRITINIAIDGLRLRDEKSGDSLYHHPVHKISFIAQDMTDSRAFGYIFGSPDTGHRFFGIKTDKAASQVVIAMRDLFQVVFALKKKEIELAKQHLDKSRFTSSPLFADSSLSNTKLQPITQEITKNLTSDKACTNSEIKSDGTAVADLVDLELELNSLQQGLNQMERITPSEPFGSKDDPFGDSFTNYTKPILPPPPSSGRDRSSRTSESSSIFSPRTPRNVASLDTSCDNSLFNSNEGKIKKDVFSQDSSQEAVSEDWFTQTSGKSIFEEPPLVPEPTKDERHGMTKREILSQFDVFTELDPLGTGKSKPYIDKKHFFQELKNPPKKVLNDLVSQAQHQETNLFNRNFPVARTATHTSDFTTDPFGEDPFVTEDPFSETDFTRNDPFETEFTGLKSKLSKSNNCKNFKSEISNPTENLQLGQTNRSKSSKDLLEKQMLIISNNSPKAVHFNKQSTFEVQFDKFESKQNNKLMRLHENVSLDISSESESAPEPPPRPESTLMQIKPPPLPPKKQGNDFSVKPPPRPPYVEESHYDYMVGYEIAPNSLEIMKNLEKSPPIPLPARKSKFESQYGPVPEKPKKQFNVVSSDEDYLTPISLVDQKAELKTITRDTSPALLPPPQRSCKKQNTAQVTIASYLDSKPNVTTSMATDNLSSLEGLDITLSQLTISGLNELATKLNIPANQLSNMTLVQLTNYLSNFIKSKTNNETASNLETNSNSAVPTFNADFAANFNNLNSNATMTSSESYDRYAVFRELINEEIKQTKIDTEPEELQKEKSNLSSSLDRNVNNIFATIDNDTIEDKYAALREIVESELKLNETEHKDNNKNGNERNMQNEQVNSDQDEIAVVNIENKLIDEENEKSLSPNYNLIEYNASLEGHEFKENNESIKSPINKAIKSPVPSAITDIIQNNVQLNSGSLSDVVSGSSPEVDNTGSNSEVGKRPEDAAGESWAIFDQGIPLESVKGKPTLQSEEGVSPWSSDSKEFANGSPLEWQRGDSESGGDHWPRRRIRKDQEGWWDTSAEPEMQYYPSNRRSTDSYDDDNYESYERPRRRKQANYVHCGQGAGGHSSSSRDVSPWEEEPRRETRESRASWIKHARQHSLEKYRERRHADSWDDEDDYEYEEERIPRLHRSDRQKWEMERERYDIGNREHSVDKWDDEWNDERRHRRRREGERERWCCPDWDISEHEKPSSRYNAGRNLHTDGPPGMWRDRKHDERYYSRESQESPWEDDYSNEAEEISSSHYLTTKRNWKRPSSASEMERKTGEIRSRHYLAAGGSDGERDRRYKPGRRSRSRDSQYSETSYRYKTETGPPARGPHRNKQYSKQQFENDFADIASKKQIDNSKLDHSNKKSATLTSRKKTKDSPKAEMNIVGTFPRKSSSRNKSLFENDFVPPANSPMNLRAEAKFNLENDFETSGAESPTVLNKSLKGLRQHTLFEKSQIDTEFNRDNYRQRSLKELKLSPRLQSKSNSLFEDDFSPSGKLEPLPKDNSISSIKEEVDPKAKERSFSTNNFENATNSRKKKINRHRLSNSIHSDINIKKSESVNIFARESDPFDDDFFSENVSSHKDLQHSTESSPKPTDLKWTEDFEEFPVEEK